LMTTIGKVLEVAPTRPLQAVGHRNWGKRPTVGGSLAAAFIASGGHVWKRYLRRSFHGLGSSVTLSGRAWRVIRGGE